MGSDFDQAIDDSAGIAFLIAALLRMLKSFMAKPSAVTESIMGSPITLRISLKGILKYLDKTTPYQHNMPNDKYSQQLFLLLFLLLLKVSKLSHHSSLSHHRDRNQRLAKPDQAILSLLGIVQHGSNIRINQLEIQSPSF